MKNSSVFLPLLTGILLLSFKTDKPAYRIFDRDGKPTGYRELLKEAGRSDIILFGELHDNPICHWLEFELVKDLYSSRKGELILGAEMFETDNQLLLDEYTGKIIRKKDFEAEAKLWKNYRTDYAPFVNFAAEKGIRVVASNLPRRYAAMVNSKGFDILDSLTGQEKALLPPLPVPYDSTLDCYKNILKSMGEGASSHATPNIAKAQALKDAAMAWSILQNHRDGDVFLHFNGTYHSDDFQGISWYLREYGKKAGRTLKILTISSAEQDTLDDLSPDNRGKGDFILCIPGSMTKTQ